MCIRDRYWTLQSEHTLGYVILRPEAPICFAHDDIKLSTLRESSYSRELFNEDKLSSADPPFVNKYVRCDLWFRLCDGVTYEKDLRICDAVSYTHLINSRPCYIRTNKHQSLTSWGKDRFPLSLLWQSGVISFVILFTMTENTMFLNFISAIAMLVEVVTLARRNNDSRKFIMTQRNVLWY